MMVTFTTCNQAGSIAENTAGGRPQQLSKVEIENAREMISLHGWVFLWTVGQISGSVSCYAEPAHSNIWGPSGIIWWLASSLHGKLTQTALICNY